MLGQSDDDDKRKVKSMSADDLDDGLVYMFFTLLFFKIEDSFIYKTVVFAAAVVELQCFNVN